MLKVGNYRQGRVSLCVVMMDGAVLSCCSWYLALDSGYSPPSHLPTPLSCSLNKMHLIIELSLLFCVKLFVYFKYTSS